jgi:hypothetical protein
MKDLEIQKEPKNVYKIPATVSKTSPYYSEIPLTSGDLRQRILNYIPPPPSKYRKHLPKLYVGLTLFGGTVATVYVINAVLTLEKEMRLENLIKDRNRLRDLIKTQKR